MFCIHIENAYSLSLHCYLWLRNFFVATVAFPNTSELSFTMVCADFEPASFCVALFKNFPVLVIASLIDCDACLEGGGNRTRQTDRQIHH